MRVRATARIDAWAKDGTDIDKLRKALDYYLWDSLGVDGDDDAADPFGIEAIAIETIQIREEHQ